MTHDALKWTRACHSVQLITEVPKPEQVSAVSGPATFGSEIQVVLSFWQVGEAEATKFAHTGSFIPVLAVASGTRLSDEPLSRDPLLRLPLIFIAATIVSRA